MTLGRAVRTIPIAIIVLAFLFGGAGDVLAVDENETVGFQSNHLFESGVFGENIDVLNGGLNLSIPIGSRYQVSQYLSYQLQLAYSSKVWDHTTYSGSNPVDKLMGRSSMGLGFRLHMGRIYKDVELVGPGKRQCTWYLVTPDGNQHEIPVSPVAGSDDACTQALPAPNVQTIDTTYFKLNGFDALIGWTGPPETAPILTAKTSDGRLEYTFGKFIQVANLNRQDSSTPGDGGYTTNHNRDFGGWYVTRIDDLKSGGSAWVEVEYETEAGYQHAISRIEDSLGREITFTNECEPATPPASGCQQVSVGPSDPNRVAVHTTEISVPAFKDSAAIDNDISATYTFSYGWGTVDHVDYAALGCSPPPATCPQSSVNYLTAIHYPDFDNQIPKPGPGSAVAYSMAFGYSRYGEIITRRIPTGAIFDYAWDVYYYNTGDTRQIVGKTLYMSEEDRNPPEGEPQEAGVWTYQRQTFDGGTALTNPLYVNVTDAAGNETVYHYRASLFDQTPPPNPPPDPPPPTDYDDGYTPEWDDGVNVRIDYYSGTGATRTLILSTLPKFVLRSSDKSVE